jgi:hypothetical protein
MPESALARKLKLKGGHRAAVVNAPPDYGKALRPLPSGVNLASTLAGDFDWVQVFVTTRAEAATLVPRAAKALRPASVLWVSFPKGTSGIQTNLTRDQGWDVLHELDLKWVSLVSVNDTWSAFALRPYRPGEARQAWR